VLLDYADEHRTDSIGMYLARHGVLLRWPLTALLGDRGAPGDLVALRDRFRVLLQRPLAQASC